MAPAAPETGSVSGFATLAMRVLMAALLGSPERMRSYIEPGGHAPMTRRSGLDEIRLWPVPAGGAVHLRLGQ